ncbi:MAG TPA: hypothetical protein VE422_43070 [Terriglobia bacterium]|nr:hypothetical protein [Terriglobia bacterium]
MPTSNIDAALARSFEHASAELIARVRDAIQAFNASPPQGSETWEAWRTPKPWETRVLPNLQRYHSDLQKALRAYDAGDIMPITLAAAGYAGLSKDLEFDMSWMTEQNRAAVQKLVEDVVAVADRIHRLGYDVLKSTGRA